MDPDPNPLTQMNPDPFRIRIQIRNPGIRDEYLMRIVPAAMMYFLEYLSPKYPKMGAT
jgi:hypothetical protein